MFATTAQALWTPGPVTRVGRPTTGRPEYRDLRPFVEEIKRAREVAGLTLAEVSRRCGIDQPALSRLENGHNKNPTLDTLWRYAAAIGKRLVLTTEAIRYTRPKQGKAKRVRAARER